MKETKKIDFVIITGTGKTRLIRDCLARGLKESTQVSVYDCLGSFADLDGLYKYHNYPSALAKTNDHLFDFKEQISRDLLSDRLIFIDEPFLLIHPGFSGSDVFRLTSKSKVFFTCPDVNELIDSFPFLQNQEYSLINLRNEVGDLTLLNRLTGLFRNVNAFVNKDTLIDNIILQLLPKETLGDVGSEI